MSDSDADTTKDAGRRTKVFLSPSKKYDIYVQLMRGETTVGAAAAQAEVDRSTIMRLRQVARQGALEALAASRPGVSGKPARNVALDQARAEIDRLTRTVTEQAAGLVVLEKKRGLDLMPTEPVPTGVDAVTEQGLLDLVDYAAGRGWPVSKTCEVLGLSDRRHRRFRRRQDSGTNLDDGRPGAFAGRAETGQVEAIVEAFETFADKDFSHRRLAHRGSYGRAACGPGPPRSAEC